MKNYGETSIRKGFWIEAVLWGDISRIRISLWNYSYNIIVCFWNYSNNVAEYEKW